jgi:hypothetical protein
LTSSEAHSAASYTCRVLALAFVGLACLLPGVGAVQALPELPRVYVDTTDVPPSGRTLAVPAGGDVQAALDQAQPGDVITLQAGATYQGPFWLPSKSGTGWIIVRTSAPDSSLPPPGTRISPTYVGVMAKIQTDAFNSSAIYTTEGAHHFRFIGIEFKPPAGVYVNTLVTLGTARETSVAQLPHHLIFDRCYLHGDPTQGTTHGILLNSRHTAVIDSYLSDFKAGNDAQTIVGWNGPGPFKIINNYLEASGENVMFGGANVTIPNVIPSDIEVRHNHFFKPLRWKSDDPSWDGSSWTIKSLFELKAGQRILFDGNLLENSWAQDQVGFAFVFSAMADENPYCVPPACAMPWNVVSDITVTNNRIRHAGAGLAIGRYNHSKESARIRVANNLWTAIGEPGWGPGTLFQINNDTRDVVIEHNTAIHTGGILVSDAGPNPGLIFRNNIQPHNAYGVFGSGSGVGDVALDTYFPGALFAGNAIAGPWPTAGGVTPAYYAGHPGNFFPDTIDDVGFVNPTGDDYRLAPSSPYKGRGTDGTDLGANISTISSITAKSPAQ